jgi:hypothetical protein
MQNSKTALKLTLIATFAAAMLGVTGCSTMESMGLGRHQSAAGELTGAQEVPPVSTRASGKSTIKVANDKSVSGTVTVNGMMPTFAHIHQGAVGANGPVIIPLNKTAPNTFSAPSDTRLNDAQYTAFKDGNLYINVHSPDYPGGEIRMQMKP